MSTFNNFNPLQGTRIGSPQYLGRNLYEAENQQKVGRSGNMYPLHATNSLHGNHAQSKGCKSCTRGCSSSVSNQCPAGQHK